MKHFLLISFILLGAAYALPFQTPVPGDYSCFSSEESPFDANAQATGATLTINADGSYTFTTGQASENGSVQATENTSAELEQVFQHGSDLILQPSSGSSPYEGLFIADQQGGRYIFVYTNTVVLRCQSSGADIALAIRQVAKEQVAAETQTTPETSPESVATSSSTPQGETLTLNSGEVLSAGGSLEAGDYNCISEYYWYNNDEDTGTNIKEYLLSLYADTGTRISKDDDDVETTFVYNQATAELNVEDFSGYDISQLGLADIFSNYVYHFESFGGYDKIIWFKFYRDAQNKGVLYGESIDDSTEDDITYTLCRYAGAAQRPSPAEEQAAEIEAARFKWVTAPGQGLQLADIEGFLVNPADDAIEGFLLLKDGSAYKNLQVPPDDLDAPASKQYEPEQWGVWQRGGGNITIQWNDSSDLATFSDGADYFFDPAQKDERLNGTFSSVSGTSSGNIGFGGVVLTDYASFIFSPDGRFDSTNYSTMGSTNTIGEMSTSTGYYSDAEGTVGGSSTSNTIGDVTSGIATSVETTNPNPAPATTGTYTLDGYTLELRYDDGRIERHFIYFYGAERDAINISGMYYSTE